MADQDTTTLPPGYRLSNIPTVLMVQGRKILIQVSNGGVDDEVALSKREEGRQADMALERAIGEARRQVLDHPESSSVVEDTLVRAIQDWFGGLLLKEDHKWALETEEFLDWCRKVSAYVSRNPPSRSLCCLIGPSRGSNASHIDGHAD